MHSDSQEFEVWASNCPIVAKEKWELEGNMSLHRLRFLYLHAHGRKSLCRKICVSFQNKLPL